MKQALLITSDPGVYPVFTEAAAHAQLQIYVAETAHDAANSLQTDPLPDLVVLDLSVAHGMEFLTQLKTHIQFTHLPVLGVFEAPDSEQIRLALNAGACRYVIKAFLGNNLLPILKDLLAPVPNGHAV